MNLKNTEGLNSMESCSSRLLNELLRKCVAMTFELSAAPIVYAEAKKDITEDVIKAYDKKHP